MDVDESYDEIGNQSVGFYVTYKYKVINQAGESIEYKNTLTVGLETFKRLTLGGKIAIVYLVDRPELSRLAGN